MSKNPREKGAVNEQSLQEIAGPQARTETYASTSSSSSEESLKHWIRADKDAPNDIKGSSKREELKYPTAIVYDSEKCTLEAHNRESLQCMSLLLGIIFFPNKPFSGTANDRIRKASLSYKS